MAPQPGTSKRAAGQTIYPYLLRQAGYHARQSDLSAVPTYILIARGFFHLTTVVHVSSHRVLTHKMAITLKTCRFREIPRFSTRRKASSRTGAVMVASGNAPR